MTTDSLLRSAPAIRDALARASWDDLERIGARHGVVLAGRRRAVTVERLATLLEQPDQLRAAANVLNETARATLSLLLLLGHADDERALAVARDRLRAARPDLDPALSRAHLATDLHTLLALGLIFRERRRISVPREVFDALTPAIAPGVPSDPLSAPPRPFAAVRFTIETLVEAIRSDAPAALLPPTTATDQATPYQPLLLSLDVAARLGERCGVPAAMVVTLVSVLDAMGAITAVRGRWQVQPAWTAIRSGGPRALLAAVIKAWLHPRAASDVAATGEYVWLLAPDEERAALLAREAQLRVQLWRWLGWIGAQPVAFHSLCQTLHALHGTLLAPADDEAFWIAGSRSQRVQPAPDVVLPAVVRVQLAQLAALGLVSFDETTCQRTPLAAWLDHSALLKRVAPSVASDGARTLRVDPLAVEPPTLNLIEQAGRMIAPDGEYLRYALDAASLAEWLAGGRSIAALEAALHAAGAQLDAAFAAQLADWHTRAGRVRLHRPLTLIVTAEDVPLDRILAVAGLADAAQLGPGCAAIEPERVPAALEALRARGLWPQVVSG